MPETEVHSHIGASSTHRWMNCPGSVALYGMLTERRTSEYALTGTLAHLVCELSLVQGEPPARYLDEHLALGDGVHAGTVTEAIVEAVKVYVDHVRLQHHKFGGKLIVEQSFDLSWLYPGMFGRNDAAIVPDKLFGTLRIFDYKNGRKHVSAVNNPQLMYYALGALGKDNPLMVEKVVCTIVQPNAMGKDAIEEWETTPEELYDWAYNVLLPAAEATAKPDAPCVSGDWCGFCDASALCRKRQEEALALLDAPAEPAVVATLPAIETLSPERIGLLSAFFTGEPFTQWVKSLAAEEQALLASGVSIPGRKLIETVVRGNRKWADNEAVTEEFADLGGEILETKLKSPAQVEKLLQQRGFKPAERKARVDKLTTREESVKAIVVNEDDPREAIENKEKFIDLF